MTQEIRKFKVREKRLEVEEKLKVALKEAYISRKEYVNKMT